MKINKARLMALIASLVVVLILGAVTSVAAQDQTPEAPMPDMGMGGANAVALLSTTESGVPDGIDKATWQKAFGVASMDMGTDGTDTITAMFTGLVPDGLYTLWWVNMMPSMSMGPAGGTPANEFHAGADGKAIVTFTAASDNDYQTLFVVYHADGKTHGEDPGKMGSETFSQLMGEFPGPHGMMASMDGGQMMGVNTALLSTTEDGVPDGIDQTAWEGSFGVASMLMGNSGMDVITVMLTGLVPDGVYTMWWVNMNPSMSMGPAGGTPANEFKADSDGNALATFTVPSDNDYQTLFVVYHADGKTHGADPGKMGSETFSQLMGEFPGPANMAMDQGANEMQSTEEPSSGG